MKKMKRFLSALSAMIIAVTGAMSVSAECLRKPHFDLVDPDKIIFSARKDADQDTPIGLYKDHFEFWIDENYNVAGAEFICSKVAVKVAEGTKLPQLDSKHIAYKPDEFQIAALKNRLNNNIWSYFSSIDGIDDTDNLYYIDGFNSLQEAQEYCQKLLDEKKFDYAEPVLNCSYAVAYPDELYATERLEELGADSSGFDNDSFVFYASFEDAAAAESFDTSVVDGFEESLQAKAVNDNTLYFQFDKETENETAVNILKKLQNENSVKELYPLSVIRLETTGGAIDVISPDYKDGELNLPDDYKSALSFYESNGETAVTADGKEAIIVIPCINSEQYAYVMEHSDGCAVNLTGTYYQDDKGFEVYKADLDGESDIEIMYEFYDLEKNEKAFAGEDIELNYNYKDGKFEADAVPKTAMQTEIFMKNGGIKPAGKNVIIALSQAQSSGFKLEQLNNDPTSSEPSGLDYPVLKYSGSETLCDSVANMKLYNGRLERPVGGSSTVVYEYEFGQKQGPCVLTFAEKRGNYASKIHRISLFSSDESVEIKSHETFHNGDATMDGEINVFDAVKIAKSTLNSSELNSEQKMLSDANYDGDVNIFDAVAVAKKTV